MPSSKHPEDRHSGSRHLHHTLMKLKGEITAAGSVDLGAQYFHWSLFCDTAAIWNQLANHAVDAASRLIINMLRSVFDTLSFRSHSFQRSQYFFDFLPIQNPLSPTLCKHYSSGESLIWDTLLSTSWTMLHPFVKNLPIAASRACPLCYIIYEINYFRDWQCFLSLRVGVLQTKQRQGTKELSLVALLSVPGTSSHPRLAGNWSEFWTGW